MSWWGCCLRWPCTAAWHQAAQLQAASWTCCLASALGGASSDVKCQGKWHGDLVVMSATRQRALSDQSRLSRSCCSMMLMSDAQLAASHLPSWLSMSSDLRRYSRGLVTMLDRVEKILSLERRRFSTMVTSACAANVAQAGSSVPRPGTAVRSNSQQPVMLTMPCAGGQIST